MLLWITVALVYKADPNTSVGDPLHVNVVNVNTTNEMGLNIKLQ